MGSLYLTQHGLTVNKDGGRLIIKKAGNVLKELPLKFVQNIVVMAAVQITYGAVIALLGNGGNVIYLNGDGTLKGILGNFRNDGAKIVKQAAACSSPAKRIALARYFVKNKIMLQKSLITNYNKKLQNTHLETTYKKLNYFTNMAEQQQDVNKLMGIEGITTRIYFECFSQILEGTGFEWNGRNRRPPLDPVNAMLSFAYYLLEKEVKAVIIGEGYHCGIGFLHSVTNNENSFVYDVMELFRTPAAEKFVFKCISYAWVKPDDFTYSEGKCLLTENARSNFISRFEDYMHDKNINGQSLHNIIMQRLTEINRLMETDETNKTE